MSPSAYNRYLAIPQAGKGPGVLVLHAWWGLNDFFREVCDRLAQAGFVALAPDMFSGEVVDTIEAAEQRLTRFNEAEAVPPILTSALLELRKHPALRGRGLGVVGFSMGAYWSLMLSLTNPSLFRAVTLFYGTNGGDGNFEDSQAAFQGHFAEKDPYESDEGIRALEQNLIHARRPTTFYTYEGTGHWFFEKDRPETYNPLAARLAWERTVAFLRDQLE
jgi:carboxymethylenebutenolidase